MVGSDNSIRLEIKVKVSKYEVKVRREARYLGYSTERVERRQNAVKRRLVTVGVMYRTLSDAFTTL